MTACGRGAAAGYRAGDRVVPNRSYVDGTWRREVVARAKVFDVIDRDVPVHEAAMLTVNPCTAYRLLEDNGVVRERRWCSTRRRRASGALFCSSRETEEYTR